MFENVVVFCCQFSME